MNYYKNTEQITKLVKYEFKLPEYGPSTTDPTYYEPAATRISNMRKSASANISLYDFDGKELPKIKEGPNKGQPDWSKQDISNAKVTPGRKPGMTREEISQHMNEAQENLNEYQEKLKQENIENQKQIKQVQKTIESIGTNNESTNNAE